MREQSTRRTPWVKRRRLLRESGSNHAIVAVLCDLSAGFGELVRTFWASSAPHDSGRRPWVLLHRGMGNWTLYKLTLLLGAVLTFGIFFAGVALMIYVIAKHED
jgi:hypothetical protein